MSPDIHGVFSECGRVLDWITQLRRDFHRFPELSGEEERTAARVAEILASLGVEVRSPVGGHGVVGIIRGPGDRAVGLRADMDALPITEENQVDYCSQVPGVMHACGHDAHTAMLLGVARVFSEMREADELPGSVCLYFQPAEESGGGAEDMIAQGALDNPRPQYVIAQHVWPDLPAGSVALSPGPVTAATDTCEIQVRATGGHGAAPHRSPDPIVAASHLVTALQTVVSRTLDPLDPAVVTVGTFQGGTRPNIIPPLVTLGVTIRNSSAKNQDLVEDTMRRLAENTARAYGCEAFLDYRRGYPPVINHPETTERVAGVARELLGASKVHPSRMSMGGEDFSYFSQEVPGCFLRLGISNPQKGLTYSVHNPRFDLDEDALSVGAGVMAAAALRFLVEG